MHPKLSLPTTVWAHLSSDTGDGVFFLFKNNRQKSFDNNNLTGPKCIHAGTYTSQPV